MMQTTFFSIRTRIHDSSQCYIQWLLQLIVIYSRKIVLFFFYSSFNRLLFYHFSFGFSIPSTILESTFCDWNIFVELKRMFWCLLCQKRIYLPSECEYVVFTWVHFEEPSNIHFQRFLMVQIYWFVSHIYPSNQLQKQQNEKYRAKFGKGGFFGYQAFKHVSLMMSSASNGYPFVTKYLTLN